MTSQSNLVTTQQHIRDVSPAADALAELETENTGIANRSQASNTTMSLPNSSLKPDTDTGAGTVSDIEPVSDVNGRLSEQRTSTPRPSNTRTGRAPSRNSGGERLAPEQDSTHCDTEGISTPDQSAIQGLCADPNLSAVSSQNDDGSISSTMHSSQTESPASYHSIVAPHEDGDGENEGGIEASHNSSTQTEEDDMGDLHERLRVPIVGYEVMEERARFTVFKVQVRMSEHDTWFIFRRYTDFVRLNDKLKRLFPHFRLALPPKRWFGDNFERCFLDDRLLGLQAFVNNVSGHKDVLASVPVRRFFCLDEPPGPHESLEESRALCESLEDQNYTLQRDVEDRDARIALLQEELALQQKEIDNLEKSIKLMGRSERRRGSGQSELSMNDTSALAEADQQRMNNIDWSEVPVTRRSPIREQRGLYDNHRLSLGSMSVQSMERVPEETDRPCDDVTANLRGATQPSVLMGSPTRGTTGSPMRGDSAIAHLVKNGRKGSPLTVESGKSSRESAANRMSKTDYMNGSPSLKGDDTKEQKEGPRNDTSDTKSSSQNHYSKPVNHISNPTEDSLENNTKRAHDPNQRSKISAEKDSDDSKSMTSTVSADSLQIIDHGSGKLQTYRSHAHDVISGAN